MLLIALWQYICLPGPSGESQLIRSYDVATNIDLFHVEKAEIVHAKKYVGDILKLLYIQDLHFKTLLFIWLELFL